MPSPEMEGTAVLISIQCRCNLTSKGCLCHGKQGTSESISPWKRIIIFQTIPGFRALFGRILVRTGFSTFFSQNCNCLPSKCVFSHAWQSLKRVQRAFPFHQIGRHASFLHPGFRQDSSARLWQLWQFIHRWKFYQVLAPSTASGRDSLASMP